MCIRDRPLTLVANQILPQPLYVLFIVGGAMFALATTLNSQIMSCTKPVMQSCEDGWFPQSLASLSKYKTPWKILIIYYFILVVPILADLNIAQISSIVQILGYLNNLVLTITAMKPVSYTHLDVYKRQALEKPPSGGAEGARRNSCVNLSGKRTECKKRSSGQFGGRVSPVGGLCLFCLDLQGRNAAFAFRLCFCPGLRLCD